MLARVHLWVIYFISLDMFQKRPCTSKLSVIVLVINCTVCLLLKDMKRILAKLVKLHLLLRGYLMKQEKREIGIYIYVYILIYDDTTQGYYNGCGSTHLFYGQ